MAVEILGGSGLHKAFKELGIKATRTYRRREKPHYEVWELSKDDLKKLEYTDEWKDEWGWWRFAKGSNMCTPFDFFQVNHKELIAWDGPQREDLRDDWEDEPDEEKATYHYSFKAYQEEHYPHSYDNLLEYMCNELGASMADNICALAVDLARANGMTMAKLFEIYEG
jgi:hypothetical protein